MNSPGNAEALVRFGQRVPIRTIVASVLIAVGVILLLVVISFASGRVEQIPYALFFLTIPGIIAPLSIVFNQYAEFDRGTGLISINGSAPRPLMDITYCTTDTSRGVCTINLGFGPRRSEQFSVSSNTPFGNPRVERDWVRHLLPHMGLPPETGPSTGRSETRDDAQRFAHDWLK